MRGDDAHLAVLRHQQRIAPAHLPFAVWVIEVSRPNDQLLRDWNRRSRVEEFIGSFGHCTYDWLDIPAVLRAADAVYEYPMVDQDPLPFWTADRVTLLGDAAHPMMPRGSNGAAQAIIDAPRWPRCSPPTRTGPQR